MSVSKYLSRHLTDFFIRSGVIMSSEASYYSYSFEFVLDMVLFSCLVVLIGLAARAVLFSVLTLICILPLRMLAGGAHAPSKELCGAISYFFVLACILATKCYDLLPDAILDRHYILWVSYLPLSLGIVRLAPIEHKNKRFSSWQKARLKRCCLRYSIVLFFIFLISYLLGQYRICFLMVMTSVIVLSNQYIGLIQMRAGFDISGKR